MRGQRHRSCVLLPGRPGVSSLLRVIAATPAAAEETERGRCGCALGPGPTSPGGAGGRPCSGETDGPSPPSARPANRRSSALASQGLAALLPHQLGTSHPLGGMRLVAGAWAPGKKVFLCPFAVADREEVASVPEEELPACALPLLCVWSDVDGAGMWGLSRGQDRARP